MNVKLRMTGRQDAALRKHLFPGDGNEAAAVMLCGRGNSDGVHVLAVHEIMLVRYDECPVREPGRLVWRTETIVPVLEKAMRTGMAIVKVHSHPGGYPRFSPTDDAADREFFPSVHGWTDDGLPHASVIALPDGGFIGRTVDEHGRFEPLALITVAGDDLRIYRTGPPGVPPEFARRHAQAFGDGTTDLLRALSVAVVGASGTGSLVIEWLARLGVGLLVIVDPGRVEEKNLNRIVNATRKDVEARAFKVDVAAQAVERMDLGTKVLPIRSNVLSPAAVRAVAACDVAFGCMDGAEGRHLLNRLAAFYNLPYIDVGVRLEADGHGGVDQICGTVHYLQPDGSSLLSRNVITLEDVRAEGLRRTDPVEYERQLREAYIKGVRVDRPAVATVNGHYASAAVNELLARVHGFRTDGNRGFAMHGSSLTDAYQFHEPDGMACAVLVRHGGRGDVSPLLDMPALSEGY